MTDLPSNSEIEVVPKRKPGALSKYAPEVWTEAQDLIENHPETSLSAIAKKFEMPITTLESKALRSGWLNKRDLSKVRKADESLKKIVREVAFQINDLHAHVIAMLEAVQYSFRIKIVRDDDGTMHYLNFDDFPDRPANWEELTAKQKDAYRRYIPPPRLKSFLEQVHYILQRQTTTIDFVTKMTKAALPKIDPEIVNLSTRPAEDNKFVDNTGIFETTPKQEIQKNLDELIETTEKEK
jgi:hypothetical protein